MYKKSVLKSANFESGHREAASVSIDPLPKVAERNSPIGWLFKIAFTSFFPLSFQKVVVDYISLGLEDPCIRDRHLGARRFGHSF